VNFEDDRQDNLTQQVCGVRVPDAIKKLISKLHSKGREMEPHARKVGDLTDIQYQFELVPDEAYEPLGFGAEFVETKALEAMELAASVKPVLTGIDGADMIFLPVRNGWMHKSYDLVVIDEMQDMTKAQLELAMGVCRNRIAGVGDDMQAIYAFRGADSESMARIQQELDAEELPLTTTYRCGKAIVAEAQRLVEDFSAGPDNHEGEVRTIKYHELFLEAGPGDFILSRVNAPLVNVAMRLLRNGKRTQIEGRNIGQGLIALCRKLKARTVAEFTDRLIAWREREIDRMIRAKREKLVEGIRDKADMLIELTDGAEDVAEVLDRIEALFVDDGLGKAGMITCSSVHKSKGLEADRVFVLQSTLRNHNQEEKNIQYVAITRAKKSLVWVTE
jgi:superfamily I DNA/RNA helicase